MHFGIFMEFETRQERSQAEAFQEGFRLVEAADTWGLDGVWLGEMHFNPARSVLGAPIVVASSIATRTRRLRVGMAVQVLPLNNPLRIAEEAATVDQISAGRFDFGIGRSGSPRAYDLYGVPYGESQARFFEAFEIIREAWKGERFSHHGEYYNFDNAIVSPRPYQQPHPPIRMAATTEETFPKVGEMGLPIFVGLRGMDIPTYGATWKPTARPGRKPAMPGAVMCFCAFPSMLGRPSRGRWRSPAIASCTILRARRTFNAPAWDAPALVRPTGGSRVPTACSACPMRKFCTPKWPLARPPSWSTACRNCAKNCG